MVHTPHDGFITHIKYIFKVAEFMCNATSRQPPQGSVWDCMLVILVVNIQNSFLCYLILWVR